MRHQARIQIGSLSLFGANVFGALMVLAGIIPSAFAAEIIIFREVPTHNVLEPLPPGYGDKIAVPTEEKDLILSLVPGPKLLGDGDFSSVVGSPPPNGGPGASGLNNDVLGHPIDGSRGEPLSNLPNSGMGSFSSLGGLGGQISGQVGGTINNAMQGLGGALGASGPQ